MIKKNKISQSANAVQKENKFIFGLKSYLTDWRNLLGHTLLGIIFLIIAIWAPVDWWIKLIVIAGLISFNIWRMNRKHDKQTPLVNEGESK